MRAIRVAKRPMDDPTRRFDTRSVRLVLEAQSRRDPNEPPSEPVRQPSKSYSLEPLWCGSLAHHTLFVLSNRSVIPRISYKFTLHPRGTHTQSHGVRRAQASHATLKPVIDRHRLVATPPHVADITVRSEAWLTQLRHRRIRYSIGTSPRLRLIY